MLKPTKNNQSKAPTRRPAKANPAAETSIQPAISARAITPEDWPLIEQLFGPNGACGGCWCMTWRVPRGGKLWEESKGEKNKRAFKKLFLDGQVFGCLAFAADVPVGWCCIGPRADFLRLATIRNLQTKWSPTTWSVTCFFIRSPWRRKGVATALLVEAVKVAKANGAAELEAYPVKPYTDNVPAAFAWTGIPLLFEKQKFVDITPPQNSRPIFRKAFRSPRPKT